MLSMDKIFEMQENRIAFLIAFLSKVNNGNISKAVSQLYKTKIFEMLKDINSEFYLKSEAELVFLLKKELMGDWESWNRQAFDVY